MQFDLTAKGLSLKVLNVIDASGRLSLAIRVGRRCQAKHVVAVLAPGSPWESGSADSFGLRW